MVLISVILTGCENNKVEDLESQLNELESKYEKVVSQRDSLQNYIDSEIIRANNAESIANEKLKKAMEASKIKEGNKDSN